VLVRAALAGTPGPGLLALRAERLRIRPPREDKQADNQVEGIVADCAYAGETLTLQVRLADGTLLRVVRGLADGLSSAQMEPGTVVTVGWPPSACILLPE
jgi:hypothetical protein